MERLRDSNLRRLGGVSDPAERVSGSFGVPSTRGFRVIGLEPTAEILIPHGGRGICRRFESCYLLETREGDDL